MYSCKSKTIPHAQLSLSCSLLLVFLFHWRHFGPIHLSTRVIINGAPSCGWGIKALPLHISFQNKINTMNQQNPRIPTQPTIPQQQRHPYMLPPPQSSSSAAASMSGPVYHHNHSSNSGVIHPGDHESHVLEQVRVVSCVASLLCTVNNGSAACILIL